MDKEEEKKEERLGGSCICECGTLAYHHSYSGCDFFKIDKEKNYLREEDNIWCQKPEYLNYYEN